MVHFKARSIERFVRQLATAYGLYERDDKRAWEFVALVANDLRAGLHEFYGTCRYEEE